MGPFNRRIIWNANSRLHHTVPTYRPKVITTRVFTGFRSFYEDDPNTAKLHTSFDHCHVLVQTCLELWWLAVAER